MSRIPNPFLYQKGGGMVNKSAVFEDDKNVSSFISKLSMMLQDPTAQPFVCWSPSGESILIVDPPRFSSQILPRYFKHSNFASFVRQLNLYGFHKTSQESDSCEFSHPVFRQGNEHVFKEIRRKVASQPFSERDCSKSRSEMERMIQSIEELKERQVEFEKALEQKEAEKMLIYQEMLQSKHRQDILEARMSKMVGVLMQACHSIGLTQIEGDGGSGLLQILDSETNADSTFRGQKRQRLIENVPGMSGERAGIALAPTDGMSFLHSESMAHDLLDALSAKLSSVSGGREKLLSGMFRSSSKPTLEDVTDSLDSCAFTSEGDIASRQSPDGAPSESPYNYDSTSAVRSCSTSNGLGEGGVVPGPSTQSTDLEGEGMLAPSILLSPRGFDNLDCLPTEPLNSIELNLGSQSFNLDSILCAAAEKRDDQS